MMAQRRTGTENAAVGAEELWHLLANPVGDDVPVAEREAAAVTFASRYIQSRAKELTAEYQTGHKLSWLPLEIGLYADPDGTGRTLIFNPTKLSADRLGKATVRRKLRAAVAQAVVGTPKLHRCWLSWSETHY
jgi:hypothetical protein